MNDDPTDVLTVLRERELQAYMAWKLALDDILIKQAEWERARRAYHDELVARARLTGGVR